MLNCVCHPGLSMGHVNLIHSNTRKIPSYAVKLSANVKYIRAEQRATEDGRPYRLRVCVLLTSLCNVGARLRRARWLVHLTCRLMRNVSASNIGWQSAAPTLAVACVQR